MNDLLKEAIADAKAVRTTALANAKLALEEAFTPKLQSMLSAKIREEAEYDMDEAMRDDEMEEGEMRDETMREDEHEMDEMEHDMETEGHHEMDEMEHDIADESMREDEHEMDEMEDHNEMREDEHEMDEMEHDMEEGGMREDDLELESIIKELEGEIEEDEMEEPEISESNDTSSAIGTADNKMPAPATNADSTDDPEGTGVDTLAESEDGMEGESETLDTLTEEDDEIDLEEVIRSLREEEELEESEDGMEGESEVINNLTEKLKESYSVVKFLRSKINEVNLLNAKLLFTNKLFRNGQLTEGQKLKVIETFDRAKSTREVKLVYTTLAESRVAPRKTKKAVREGFASKRVASTRPSKSVLNEGALLANRFQKLAGLIK